MQNQTRKKKIVCINILRNNRTKISILYHRKEITLTLMNQKLIKKRNLNTHRRVCKLSQVYLLLWIYKNIWSKGNAKIYLYWYLTTLRSSKIMQTCQEKSSSHFPFHSTLHFCTAELFSMEQIRSNSAISTSRPLPESKMQHMYMQSCFEVLHRFCNKENLCILRLQALISNI